MNWLRRLGCAIGMHGPNAYGNETHERSQRTDSFERTCGVCGMQWHGYMTENRYERYAIWVRAVNGKSKDPR